MCIPIDPISTTLSVLGTAVNTITKTNEQNKQIKKTNEYRAQIAQNNIQNSINEARKQQQLGIDKSREEKIEGIRNANRLMAKNASSGFDVGSSTNAQNYDDMLNSAYSNAHNVKVQYDANADSYFKKANDYINEYNSSIANQQKSNLFLTALNTASKVSTNWYSKGGKNGYI